MSTRAQLLATVAADFPTNGVELISAADARNSLDDIIDSCWVPETDGTPAVTNAANSFTGLQTLTGSGASTGLRFGASAGILVRASADTTAGDLAFIGSATGAFVFTAGSSTALRVTNTATGNNDIASFLSGSLGSGPNYQSFRTGRSLTNGNSWNMQFGYVGDNNAANELQLQFFAKSPNVTFFNDLRSVFGSSIATSAPNTGTAGAWKLGIFRTSTTVALDTANWVELDIGGTLRRLALITIVTP